MTAASATTTRGSAAATCMAVVIGWALGCTNDNGSSPTEGGSAAQMANEQTTGGTTAEGTGGSGKPPGDSGGSGGASDTGGSGGGGSSAGGSGGSNDDAGGSGGSSAGGSGGSNDDAGGAGDGTLVTTGIYANVTAVRTSGSPGAYTFAVTIESADIDCSQYADWWEVLSEDGSLLYRRILTHSHTDENGTTDADAPGNTFTRDGGPIDAQADQTVIVRAHMSTGGYHGQVMRGSAEGGFEPAGDIDGQFAASVEGEEPQAGSCAF